MVRTFYKQGHELATISCAHAVYDIYGLTVVQAIFFLKRTTPLFCEETRAIYQRANHSSRRGVWLAVVYVA